jgi:protocatechuate 3,4-dioxygenase beta subunit
MCKSLLLTLAFAGLCIGQVAPPKARVDGRVINQAGLPLSNATVALEGNDRTHGALRPPVYTTTSRTDGGFVFEGIEPNSYRLFVQRTGYLTFVYSRPEGNVNMPIAEGERKTIEVKMTAPSFLSGTVIDENGEPFPDARVTVYRVDRPNGKKRLRALSPIITGRDGSFSTGSLSAGRYYLGASGGTSLTQSSQREVRLGGAGESERYVPVYYPSALDTSAATIIDLPSATELRSMNIRLRKVRVFHIAGNVVNASGAVIPNSTVNLLYPDVTDWMGSEHPDFGVEGAFEINGLPPGNYTLKARAGRAGELQGRQIVALTDRDMDNVALTLAPGLEISLTVRIEDADPEQAQKIRKSLGRFVLSSSDGVNPNPMAEAKADGSWLFRNLGPGTYWTGLRGPDGTYVKSIRFGNQDITNSELDTSSGGGALEMVISARAAEVTGVVRDSNDQPLSGIAVTLWTPGLPPPGTVDQAKSTNTDAMGHFRFGNLPPGEYRIAAWERIEAGMGDLSEFHVRFDSTATVVKVIEDSRQTVQPVLIGREKVEMEAAALQ